jgi:hypothetical protein
MKWWGYPLTQRKTNGAAVSGCAAHRLACPGLGAAKSREQTARQLYIMKLWDVWKRSLQFTNNSMAD